MKNKWNKLMDKMTPLDKWTMCFILGPLVLGCAVLLIGGLITKSMLGIAGGIFCSYCFINLCNDLFREEDA